MEANSYRGLTVSRPATDRCGNLRVCRSPMSASLCRGKPPVLCFCRLSCKREVRRRGFPAPPIKPDAGVSDIRLIACHQPVRHTRLRSRQLARIDEMRDRIQVFRQVGELGDAQQSRVYIFPFLLIMLYVIWYVYSPSADLQYRVDVCCK